jgi:hypothetical protein
LTLALPYLGGLLGGGSSKGVDSEEGDTSVDGDDSVFGGSGDDLMDAFNVPVSPDVVFCGPGDDRAYTDGTDLLAADCEEGILGSRPDAWDRNLYQPAPLRR